MPTNSNSAIMQTVKARAIRNASIEAAFTLDLPDTALHMMNAESSIPSAFGFNASIFA